jgi:hypothetical protein
VAVAANTVDLRTFFMVFSWGRWGTSVWGWVGRWLAISG